MNFDRLSKLDFSGPAQFAKSIDGMAVSDLTQLAIDLNQLHQMLQEAAAVTVLELLRRAAKTDETTTEEKIPEPVATC